MKKTLKEQITQGNCANYTYMYNPGATTAWDWIDTIVSQFGETANFGDYYSQRPTQNHPNCCKDENGVCLGRTHTLHSNYGGGHIYYGQVNAQNWKSFIDQLNTVHQVNNEPANFTYSDTWSSMYSKLIWSGMGQSPIKGSGNGCSNCNGTVTPPIYQATDDVKNTTTTNDDDDETELNCKHNPEEGCWSCHSNPQAGGSCWQPPQMWIDTYHPSLGHNFYDTETDCINAGPLCKKDENKKKDKKDKVTKDISEDIKRMKGLIKY
mgnify:CR=1 FL=1|jgi:hypothetical protein|tara:strand:- start:83 stop:877 length:795 start_codon:yes stop_codon:yes gene_type:complete